MLKINKYVLLTKKIPQVSWLRHYNYEGKCPPRYECKQPEENENDRFLEYLKKKHTPRLFKCEHHRDFRIYRNIFFFICVPTLLFAYINIVYFNKEERKRPKFVEYTYMRIRNKPYGWDPVRTLFHNRDLNALPKTGYETVFPEENEYDPMTRYRCPVPRKE